MANVGQFDVGDPNSTFTTAVPQRACCHPPLLNAIFYAAARHLLGSRDFRLPDDTIRYDGVLLPKLNDASCEKYLSAVIRYLTLAGDPENVMDESFLAAAVILRFAADFYASIDGEQLDTFRRTFRHFINARFEAEGRISGSFLASPSDQHEWAQKISPSPALYEIPRYSDEQRLQERGLRHLRSFEHACLRVALRQEVVAACLSQDSRHLHMLPRTWSALELLPTDNAPEEDFVWADRQLELLAKVVRYCFESDEPSPANHARYAELKEIADTLHKHRPFSFAPYHDPPELHNGSAARQQAGQKAFVLPQCWYINDTHVVGSQYNEMSKILLLRCSPTLPKFGRKAVEAEDTIRDCVTRTCGIGMSTRTSVFARELAYVAVKLTSHLFRNVEEQNVLMSVLDSIERDWGWPTELKRKDLWTDWGREENHDSGQGRHQRQESILGIASGVNRPLAGS
jgi:hypothetical protein